MIFSATNWIAADREQFQTSFEAGMKLNFQLNEQPSYTKRHFELRRENRKQNKCCFS